MTTNVIFLVATGHSPKAFTTLPTSTTTTTTRPAHEATPTVHAIPLNPPALPHPPHYTFWAVGQSRVLATSHTHARRLANERRITATVQ